MRTRLIIPLALAMPLLVSGCMEAESAIPAPTIRPVKLIAIEDPLAGGQRSFPARVTANSRADLAFRIAGQLTELTLVEGQGVSAGSLLARLDDRDARNNLMAREAEHELLAADYERKAELLKRKLISQAEFDTIQAQLKSAKAALAAARDQLSYTQLTAPFSGTVAKRLVDNHQQVQPNQTVLTLQNNRLLDVSVQVPESLLADLKQASGLAKLDANVSFSAFPGHSFKANFKEYSTEITPGTQAYELVFSLPQPDAVQLLPGMSAELSFRLDGDGQPIAVVPVSALDKSDADGLVRVWRYQPTSGQVDAVPVTLGRVRAEGIEVLSGLQRGDQIVSAGISQLSAGMQVKPLHWQRGV
ncbi:efflux RND transporter periplasmic adaptor subunit [Shewanella khirikhana]|uniref:Toluene efflux pump periplasmic linker protein TtgD n=1 Tax=Shewanella khirikhana TaxID=1965282 RepID=A0ABN5TNF5_9GAMM|nr:efflux RND transporter periplasmic adaptor subunit [Shewanella khirikhana]AZQ09197.1 Toluene efflux pump periplasmic linker protein TtgD precursor [Shewanella khirikhana]